MRDERWLRRMRFIGIAVPVLFIVGLQVVRPVLIDRWWPHSGDVLVGLLTAAAAIAFGWLMFAAIGRAHDELLRQNRELAALSMVSDAVRAGSVPDEIAREALAAVRQVTGAAGATITSEVTAGQLLSDVRRRWVSGEVSPDCVEWPLRAGGEVVATLALCGASAELSDETVSAIAMQIGSAILRADLVAGLQRKQVEDEAICAVLLATARQDDPEGILRAVVGQLRILLGTLECGLQLERSGPWVPAGHDWQPQHVGVSPAAEPAFVAVPLRSGTAVLGRLWAQRADGFTRADRELLHTFADLAVVALHHARMLADERYAATVAERERIARELHDSLAQVLGVIQLRLRVLGGRAELADADESRREIVELTEIAHDAYRDVREAILGLKESSRVDRSLLEGLGSFLEKYSRQSSVQTCLVNGVDGELMLSPSCEVQVIRVIQEALTNVRKHSGASHATVRVQDTSQWVTFEVVDDGCGFDRSEVGGEGFGLTSMAERAELVGGRLQVDSGRGQGTRVIIDVPSTHRVFRSEMAFA